MNSSARNASYTSTDTVTDFVKATGVWVDKSLINNFLLFHILV